MATDAIRQPRATSTAATRIASTASALFAVALFVTVAFVNVPREATDSEVLSWWLDGANQASVILSMFSSIAAAIFFIVVVNHIRSLVSSTGAATGHLTSFAHSAATAYTATMLVVAALRGVIGYQVNVLEEPLPGIDVLRYSTSLGYTLLDNVAMTLLSLSVFTISLVVIRTSVLGRWIGVLGIVCAVIIAGAIMATVGAFAIPVALLWALGTAVAIWRQPAT